MLHRYPWARKPDDPLPSEVRSVLMVRRELLETKLGQDTLEGRVPVRWRIGCRCIITWRGRDRDGSMRASVALYDALGKLLYTRHVRCVRPVRLKRNFS